LSPHIFPQEFWINGSIDRKGEFHALIHFPTSTSSSFAHDFVRMNNEAFEFVTASRCKQL
jgi:hypothetical protein